MENSLDNSEPALALEPAESLSASEEAGAWWFHALLRCGEWDPKHFTHILDKCVPKFADTLAITAILSYACRDRSTAVPAGYVAIQGYLKIVKSSELAVCQALLLNSDVIKRNTGTVWRSPQSGRQLWRKKFKEKRCTASMKSQEMPLIQLN